MPITSIIVVIALMVMFFYIASVYNTLVGLKRRFKNAFSQVDVQLKHRYDLIPNLVETSKAYMANERETLEAVIVARNTALAGLKTITADPACRGAIRKLSAAETQLQSTLERLTIAIEAYPSLKASKTVVQLRRELRCTENKLVFARDTFNDSITEYNIFRQRFPAIILSVMLGHVRNTELLEFEDTANIQKAS